VAICIAVCDRVQINDIKTKLLHVVVIFLYTLYSMPILYHVLMLCSRLSYLIVMGTGWLLYGAFPLYRPSLI
jgi:hypothetical protein